jgi:hypothetical protein
MAFDASTREYLSVPVSVRALLRGVLRSQLRDSGRAVAVRAELSRPAQHRLAGQLTGPVPSLFKMYTYATSLLASPTMHLAYAMCSSPGGPLRVAS